MTQAARAWIGFFVAPGVPAVLLYFWGLHKDYGDAAIAGPFLLAPFAYAAALVIGWPVYLMLQRRGSLGLGVYVALSAAIGLAVVVLMFGTEALLSWKSAREHAVGLLSNSGRYMVVAMVYAAVAGAVFWLIAIRQRTVNSL
jgi:hypothetical protein